VAWDVYLTGEVDKWLNDLSVADPDSYLQVVAGIDVLSEVGPSLGRPLVDRVKGSRLHGMKELRPGSAGRSEIRVLFVFDPWRSAILLVGGDKSGNWSSWYQRAIQRAERLYVEYLSERTAEEEAKG
jgi:hypothetical protein